ncbi:hypothetical protein TEA_025801 [Camellia sinensis var. sinensis]|uniref:Uncharacterized protein n=1 Tax=Camellia sinensis var. sinensis TaxID=542762 RepID=A0A4S4DH24_CAMSN|nr:hypothetical protein TEA_025801 [Camellia sinensis var. sinensis]
MKFESLPHCLSLRGSNQYEAVLSRFGDSSLARSVIFILFDQRLDISSVLCLELFIRWFLKLSQIPEVTEVPSFSGEALSYLQGLIDGFTISDALEVKNIEKVTNHDVKAVEYFLKQKCQSHPEIAKVLEFFHFVCTSEDINNLAHALMLKEALNTVIFPVMDEVIKAVCDMAKANAHVPMFSRTHGQWQTLVNVMNSYGRIFILYRLLTGAILAHELMRGWLRLKVGAANTTWDSRASPEDMEKMWNHPITILCALAEIVSMRFVNGVGPCLGIMGIDYPTACWLYKYVNSRAQTECLF